MSPKKAHHWWLGGYALLLGLYAIFSYALTAPNLILSSWEPYWNFQTWIWATFFNNRPLLSYAYLSLIIGLIIFYLLIIKTWPKKQKLSWWLPLLIASPLLLSNNALSYDVFNYIFNAKMVIVYHANPHIKVALDFFYDNWTRFMHNTHTPAPYGYGWTVLSLFPYILGGGKFLPTWISFRFFSFVSLGLLSLILTRFTQLKSNKWLLIVLINPLLLIEVVSNFHNDLWMIFPAMISLLLVTQTKKSKFQLGDKIKPWLRIILSLFLLIFSAFIKLATLSLLPLWLALVLPWRKLWPQMHTWVKNNWAFLASIALFLPLLTSRSKQFLPWYLSWSFVWIPLMMTSQVKIKKWWKLWLLSLSLSSLFRYLPFLWAGNYEGEVVNRQLLITWGLGGILFLIGAVVKKIKTS